MRVSLRSARSLRFLCLRTPAASSMSERRSSGREFRTSSSRPWLMIECVSRPRPESCSRSWMSISRAGALLIRYSLSPLRYMRRVIVTSVNSSGSVPSELSSTRSTSATPTGLPRRGAREDDVFHRLAAQRLGGLLAEHPEHGVGDVGLARAVGADDDRHAGLELHHAPVGEGLEPLEYERLEVHGPPRNRQCRDGRRTGRRNASSQCSTGHARIRRSGALRTTRAARASRARSSAAAAAAASASFLVRPLPLPMPLAVDLDLDGERAVVRRALLRDESVDGRLAARLQRAPAARTWGSRATRRRLRRSAGPACASTQSRAASMPGVEVERGDERLVDVLERATSVPRPPVPRSLSPDDDARRRVRVRARPGRAPRRDTTETLIRVMPPSSHRRESGDTAPRR